jgi:hypothetical protein
MGLQGTMLRQNSRSITPAASANRRVKPDLGM